LGDEEALRRDHSGAFLQEGAIVLQMFDDLERYHEFKAIRWKGSRGAGPETLRLGRALTRIYWRGKSVSILEYKATANSCLPPSAFEIAV
jgi:hypothetical protein